MTTTQDGHVSFVQVALRVRARTPAEAWEALERDVAPVTLGVEGIRDLRLPRSRDITMTATGEARCDVRLTISAPDDHAALALTDGPVRDAVTALPPVISVASVMTPVLPLAAG